VKSSDGTRDVAATAPTTPFGEEGLTKTSGRSPGGGGYGASFARQVQEGGIGFGQDHHRDPLAQGETGPPSDIFDRPGAGLSGT
jgi:hypothetical protein